MCSRGAPQSWSPPEVLGVRAAADRMAVDEDAAGRTQRNKRRSRPRCRLSLLRLLYPLPGSARSLDIRTIRSRPSAGASIAARGLAISATEAAAGGEAPRPPRTQLRRGLLPLLPLLLHRPLCLSISSRRSITRGTG